MRADCRCGTPAHHPVDDIDTRFNQCPSLIHIRAIFITDIAVTVATVAKLNQRLHEIDEVAHAIRMVSDAIGTVAADGTIALSDTNEKLRPELKSKHEELTALIHMEQKRLLHAFLIFSPGITK